MMPTSRTGLTLALAATVVLLPFSATGQRKAEPAKLGVDLVAPNGTVDLEIRKGTLVRLEDAVAAVFVADPDIADVQAQSPNILYVFGKRAGTTTIYAVDDRQQVVLRRDIVVRHNVSRLQKVLADAAPGAAVTVQSIDGGLIIRGSVATPTMATELRDLAGRFIGEGETLINRLVVAAPTQVSLHVRVAEVSREATKVFGINWDALLTPGDFAFGLASGRPFTGVGGGAVTRLTDTTGSANALFGGYSSGSVNINTVVDALEREGLVSVLAEPNLTALSGETATFLAGGEFPIPVNNDNGDIQVEFKQFGVSLAFTPTVLMAERISLRVRPEVSDLSDRGAVRSGTLVIPAISTRRAETTVELGSGQTFAIGGLILNDVQNTLEKLPGVADIPVLGTLFRSTRFQRRESELVILVTPYLVSPVSARTLRVPNDDRRQPSDRERVLDGQVAKRSVAPGSTSGPIRPGTLRDTAGFILE